MIEVSIWFGTIDGDGVETYTVNVEPDGFDNRPYFTAIYRATLEFGRQRPQAVVSQIKTRTVPRMATVLEVE